MPSEDTPDAASARPLAAPAYRRPLYAAIWLLGGVAIAAMLLGVAPGARLGVPLIAALLIGATTAGALSPHSGFLARPVNAVAGTAPRLALTFDDGPDPATTPRVLDLLRERGHRATFFVIGERVARFPALVRRIGAEGHELANHSMHHRWHLCFWHPRRLAADLAQVEERIRAAGAEPAPLFRPPIGILSPRIPPGTARAGLRLVGYSARAFDRGPGASVQRCMRRLKPRLQGGAIVLLHDTPKSAGPDLLRPLLDELDRRRLTSVPLGELLARETR